MEYEIPKNPPLMDQVCLEKDVLGKVSLEKISKP